MHGEPIDWGFKAVKRLGIRDLEEPDFGEFAGIPEGQIPVFWACGVTPQLAVMQLGGDIEGSVMGHLPGHMLILDVTDEEIQAGQL